MRLVAPIRKLVRFLLNPTFDIESGALIGHDGETLERPKLEFVPRFPGTPPNSPGIGSPVTPQLTSTDASGLAGPVFAQGAQAGPLGGSGAFGLQAVDVVISSAQILALLGTPVTLVPAPQAGFMIVPVAIKIIFFGGSIAYTNAGGAVNVKVGPTLLQALTEQFITTVSPNRSVGWIMFAGPAELQSSAANPPDTDGAALTLNKITNNYAAGNGTAKVTVYYTIEPTI